VELFLKESRNNQPGDISKAMFSIIDTVHQTFLFKEEKLIYCEVCAHFTKQRSTDSNEILGDLMIVLTVSSFQ